MPCTGQILEVAARIGLLRGLGKQARDLLSLLSEGLHLLAGKLALDVESLFEVFRMNKALSELEISLKVGLCVLHGLLVNLAGASSDHVGRLGDDFVSLTGSLEEAVVSFTGLFDALAGKVAHGRGNFEIHLLAHSG